MRAFVLAAIAVAVLATGTAFVLDGIQETTEMATVSAGARIDPN
jgi:hypothetical protein